MSRPLIALLCWLVSATSSAAQLAVIIDDVGYSYGPGLRAANLEGAFTLAILPFAPYAVEMAQHAHKRGKELILHIPMSNDHGLPVEQGALLSGMTHGDFSIALNKMLVTIPHITGVNNHMGSRLTREQEPMDWLMGELANRKLFFIDSRTTAETLARQTALKYRVPSAKRDIFLDNQRDPELIRAQLHKALMLARTRNSAIAIGHPYPETLMVLEQIGPLLAEHKVELVSVSALLTNTATQPPLIAARGSFCPAPPVLLWRPLTPRSTLPISAPPLFPEAFGYDQRPRPY